MKTLETFFAFTIIFLTFSCSKKEDLPDATNANVPKTLLVKTTNVASNGIETFTYDANKRLINSKSSATPYNDADEFNYLYNPDGTLDKYVKLSDGSIIAKFTYDSNKKIIKKEANQIEFLYTYNGTVVTENIKNLSNNDLTRAVYMYDINGNVTMINFYNNVTVSNPSGTPSGTTNYTYDNKNSPYQSLPQAIFFPAIRKNNVTQYSDGVNYNYIYEYNSENFPTKSTISGLNNGVFLFEYIRI